MTTEQAVVVVRC